MPQNELDQTISKRYATEIPDSQLPYDDDRRIRYDGTGCCSVQLFSKTANELLDYYVDMMRWLEPNEQIIGAAAWCEPNSLLITRLEYASSGVVAWLYGGGDKIRQTVKIQIFTSTGRIKEVDFIVQTTGVANLIPVVNIEDEQVYIGYNTVTPIPVDPEPKLRAYPNTYDFGVITASVAQISHTINVKNDGNATAYVHQISMQGDFKQTNTGFLTIAPGQTVQLNITFKPLSVAEHTGALRIDYGNGLETIATFTGEAISGNRLLTSGNQIIRPGGETYQLKSINWFGAESDVYTPHGLWVKNYKAIIDNIVDMGFNSVRIPFSGDICNTTQMPQSGTIDFNLNSDLIGKTSIEILDAIISYMSSKSLHIILDHHRRKAGDGADGTPLADDYTYDNWQASWAFMANRYKSNDFVLGADLHNEPHLLAWNTWAAFAQAMGNYIHTIAPHWLIFVEGVGSYGSNSYWWGGELSGVRDRPITLNIDHRLVYSVHEYGISVGDQPWLAKDTTIPASWPMNLYAVWRQHWGFIFEEGIAPVWMGEVGGKFGVDGSGEVTSDSNAQFERQWIYHLQRYMDGYFDGGDTRLLTSTQKGVSFAYWSLNPNSGDTGGLLQDDWTTQQSFKLELISMMLSGSDVPYVYGLTPMPWDDIDQQSQVIITQNGVDRTVTIEDLNAKFVEDNFRVGTVHFFTTSVDPNDTFPNQTWLHVPGAEKTIRIAKSDLSDLGQTGGSDTVQIAKANLPATQLNVTGTAASTDLGTKTTSTAGAHVHSYTKQATQTSVNQGQGGVIGNSEISVDTGSAGEHNHTVNIGSHSHSVSGSTENMGSGTALSVKNEYITLAAWYRSA